MLDPLYISHFEGVGRHIVFGVDPVGNQRECSLLSAL